MFDGEWLIGCPVPFEEGWRGRDKLLRMVQPAIEESLAVIGSVEPEEIPLILGVAEGDRVGRIAALDRSLLEELQARLGRRFHRDSAVIANGRVGGAQAIALARDLVAQGRPYCVVAGADSLLVGPTLTHYHAKRRLRTVRNSDGFIPGEAGAAVLLGAAEQAGVPHLRCLGIGFGKELATQESGEPLRADGMVQAFKSAVREAGVKFETLDYRITDLSGEQYGFKEASLAVARTLRVRKEEFDIWHPADCMGEVGSATVPCVLAVALAAARNGYAPGDHVLCHCGDDDGERAAMILRYSGNGAP
jgi:3-oxoacyl-[acyl-carrier-protein] synthase-1